MRISILLTFLTICLTQVIAKSPAPALPKPGGKANLMKQMTRRELVARINHPDLFGKSNNRKRQNDQGGATSETATPTCTEMKRRRRDLTEIEQILSPQEMAEFLLGRGSFTMDNGTLYTDYHYLSKLQEKANSHQGWYHRFHNVIVDSLGNKLLEVSIPYYKKWKNGLGEDELVHLSPMTAIRGQDIDELEQIMLQRPDFIDVQVHGYTISKRFVEVATSF